MRKFLLIFLSIIFLWSVHSAPLSVANSHIALQTSDRIHVICKCINSWTDGRVENRGEVELRDGTSFGPVLQEASVEVNGHQLQFDQENQTYKGPIGQVEQWQEIPLLIQTKDGRKVKGIIAVVFMIRITHPKPVAAVSSNQILQVTWDYSEGSMHTVDLEIHRVKGDPVGFEIRGNKTSIDFERLGLKIERGEKILVRILPPWTSNFEFSGNLTKRSKGYFITEAAVTLHF